MMPARWPCPSPRSVRTPRKALEDHAWQDAYEAYISLRDHEELTGEDWAGFAEAAWWSAHPNESLDAFERAYGTYSSEGNTRRAAYVALRLAFEHADRSEPALWNGWLQRAIRLMTDEPDCVERGYLELALVRSSFDRGAIDEAIEHANRAQELGARFGDRDLAALGLVLHGGALVTTGEVDRGLGLVDEGALAAVGGELTPYVAGSIYCILLHHPRRVPLRRPLPPGRRVDGRGGGLVRTPSDHRLSRRLSGAARGDHAASRRVLPSRGRGSPSPDRAHRIWKVAAGRSRRL